MLESINIKKKVASYDDMEFQIIKLENPLLILFMEPMVWVKLLFSNFLSNQNNDKFLHCSSSWVNNL